MKLGILLNNLGPSQLAFNAICEANKYAASGKHAAFLFYERQALPCLKLGVASMQIAEAWNFDGVTIATDLSTAIKLAKFPSPKEKFFYVWDLEWMRNGVQPYEVYASIYRNPSYKLLARSQSHKQVIESCWNRSVHAIIDDFSFEELNESLQ